MITVKDVEKLAELSRIALTQEEKQNLTTEIGSILDYVGQIQSVGADGENKKAGLIVNVMRDDNSNSSGVNTAVIVDEMSNKSGSYLKVKKIL